MYSLFKDRFYNFMINKEYEKNDVFFIFAEDEEHGYDAYYLRITSSTITLYDHHDNQFLEYEYDDEIVELENGREYLDYICDAIIANINIKLIDDDYKHNMIFDKLKRQLKSI